MFGAVKDVKAQISDCNRVQVTPIRHNATQAKHQVLAPVQGCLPPLQLLPLQALGRALLRAALWKAFWKAKISGCRFWQLSPWPLCLKSINETSLWGLGSFKKLRNIFNCISGAASPRQKSKVNDKLLIHTHQLWPEIASTDGWLGKPAISVGEMIGQLLP